MLALVLVVFLAAAVDGDVPLGEIKHALKDRDVLLSRYRVTYIQSGYRLGVKEDASTSRIVFLQEGDKFRHHSDSWGGFENPDVSAEGGRSEPLDTDVNTFDGGQGRQIINPRNSEPSGAFGSSPVRAGSFFEMTFADSLSLIEKALDESNAAELFTWTQWEGSRVVRFVHKSESRQDEMFLSPEFGWMPIRIVMTLFPGPGGVGVPQQVLERTLSDYRQYGGVWFPIKSVHSVRHAQVIGSNLMKPQNDWTLEVKSVEIDPPREDGEFRIKFPEGLVVLDRDSNRRYTVGAKEKLVPLEGPEPVVSPAAGAENWTWAYGVAAGVCGIAFIALLVKRYRESRV